MLMVSLFAGMPGACCALTIPGGLHADKTLRSPRQVYALNKDKPMRHGAATRVASHSPMRVVSRPERRVLKQSRSLSPLCAMCRVRNDTVKTRNRLERDGSLSETLLGSALECGCEKRDGASRFAAVTFASPAHVPSRIALLNQPVTRGRG